MDYNKYLQVFEEKFQGQPRVFRSPGRINLIGEHIDYNNGFVLPAGIDKEIAFLITPNQTDSFNLYSIDQNEEVSFTLTNYNTIKAGWARYVIGVIDQLLKAGHSVGGFNCVFGGDVPLGAGLSSSAALECASLFALNKCFDLGLSRKQIVLMAQKAENEFVGVNCGIMDQFASVFAEEKHALKLDCRDLSYQSYKIEFGDYSLLLVDSLVKHNLGATEYNVRRKECEEAVKALNRQFPEINSLRDAHLNHLKSIKPQISEKVYERARFVIEEITRVDQACEAIEANNLAELGRLIYASHDGLQNQYEVSCEELDFLVDFTRDKEGILGSRMMGGGFGGCTINLIHSDYQERFSNEVSEAYFKEFGKRPRVYAVKTANGSSEVT